MSIKIMNRIWELQDDAQSPAERLVLVTLADQCNNEGFCWPSMETIANHAGVSARYARKLIERGEERGYVLRIRRHRHGLQTSNVYIVTVGMDEAELEAAQRAAKNALGVAIDARNIRTGWGGTYGPGGAEHTDRVGRNNSSDRTVIEPLVEPPTNQQAPTPEPTLPGQPLPADEPLHDVCSFVMNLFQETFGMMPTNGTRYERDWRNPTDLLIAQAGEDETKLRVIVDEAHAKWKAARRPEGGHYPAQSPRQVWNFIQAAIVEMGTAPENRGPQPGSVGMVQRMLNQYGADLAVWPDADTRRTAENIRAVYGDVWQSDPYRALASYGARHA